MPERDAPTREQELFERALDTPAPQRDALLARECGDDARLRERIVRLLEAHGAALSTVDVARAWLMQLPVGMTFTAERDAAQQQ